MHLLIGLWAIVAVSSALQFGGKSKQGHLTLDFKLPLLDTEVPDGAIPASFNAIEEWPQCRYISEISDQGPCAADWAFAAVAAMTDRICIASNGDLQPHLSAQDLITCCPDCGQGCDGGYPTNAWNHWKYQGIVTGGNYSSNEGCSPYSFGPCNHFEDGPYSNCTSPPPSTPTCKNSCIPQYQTNYTADKHFGSNVYQIKQSVSKIQYEILLNGPVEATFDVYEDFLTYKSGIYQHQQGTLLGYHSVKIFGWGVSSDTQYWIASNSWNSYWGDNGFFYILLGSNECGIEGSVVAGIPQL